MPLLANIRQSLAELLYSNLRHAKQLQSENQRLLSLVMEQERPHSQVRELEAQRRAVNQLSFVMHRNFHDRELPARGVQQTVSPSQNIALLARIQSAYRIAHTSETPNGTSFWSGTIAERKRSEHQALMGVDTAQLAQTFADPLNSTMFYGFDNLNSIDAPSLLSAETGGYAPWRTSWIYDNLLRLCEALGLVRLEYPETHELGSCPPTDDLLRLMDHAFGFEVDFPNPYAGEPGLQTSRGIATYRAIQALYQAYLVSKFTPKRVAEIGAGLGRTAYYARKFGIPSYTIVDLPMTNAAQAHFLGMTLSDTSISLHGESCAAPIKIMPPNSFLQSDERYDLILNVDSLTELSYESAKQYFSFASQRSRVFLSINHEFNAFTVREIAGDVSAVSRHEYWLRRGYVEEVFLFPTASES